MTAEKINSEPDGIPIDQGEAERTLRLADPFGGEVEAFASAMQSRQDNHKAFLDFIDANLVDGVDFGRIHRKKGCTRGDQCPDTTHFTKPCLFKPGAEKVLGWLGVTPIWPNIPTYEELALAGDPIQTMILRCEGIMPDGACAGFGIGGRAVSFNDDGTYADLNRDLKMVKKSALIDCAITSGRISAHFTQDVEDMPPEALAARGQKSQGKKDPAGKGEQKWMHLKPNDLVPSGAHKGEKVRELSEKYLISLGEKNPRFRDFCGKELARRRKGTSGSQTLDGWKIPELGVFMAELKPGKVTAILTDRYGVNIPTVLTKPKQEELLVFMQVERATRPQFMLDQELARKTMAARFGEQAKYWKLHPDQMEELGVVLALQHRIESARQIIPDKFKVLLDDWENATGELVQTATGEQLQLLISTLQTNGFEG